MPAFTKVFALASVFASAMTAPLYLRDDWVPPVTSTTAGTVWVVGSQYNVTWDLEYEPVNITNPIGRVVLAKGGNENLFPDPLAANFSIRTGWVPVTVPSVAPGDDYSLVLFGDSGNFSPEFTITDAL